MGIYNPGIIASPLLPSITAHEIFHAWNVKRLRPADMWPYEYAREQPTSWLWVSEGITDYYADLALVRGGVIDSAQFMALTADKAGTVPNVPDRPEIGYRAQNALIAHDENVVIPATATARSAAARSSAWSTIGAG